LSAIVTKNLAKLYKGLGKSKTRSLDDLNLTIEENEVFGFLGRNGAGKTTTIKILCSLLKPTEGEALIFGKNVRTPDARHLFGYLPEQPYFYEYLTPRETVDFYGRLRGLSPAERTQQWDKLSELLYLRDIANDRLKGFSKGMRQRIGFAVALIGDPPLLILDEPMSGLDPIGRRTIRELILRLRDEKKTIFFSSHVLGDVEQICDRVGIMRKGKLIRQGRIDALIDANVRKVEVIAKRLDPEVIDTIKNLGAEHRSVDEAEVFVFDDPDHANTAVQTLQKAGGKLVAFNPLRESLEDYFMREQETHT